MGGLCIAYEALMAQRQGSATEKLYVAREYYRAFAYGWMEKGTPYIIWDTLRITMLPARCALTAA